MKKIQAIIRPEKLDEIKEAMTNGIVHGMTIRQVQGFGRSLGWKEIYRGSENIINTIPKIEIEMVVPDNEVDMLISRIISVAQTGEMGDGKIFITPVENCIRIRTEETGEAAL